MIHISIEELPQKLESLLTEIEKGESCLLVKAGTPVAEINPVQKTSQGWKRKIDKIELPKGVSAQSYLQQERQIR